MIPKTLSLIISGLLLSAIAAAQTPSKDRLNHSDTYYLKNSGQIVTTKDSADYIRVIMPPDSADLNLFLVNDFYPNGKPKLVGNSLIPQSYLKRQGVFIEYFPNGHKKTVENFNNGVITGDMIHYYPNGKLYYTATYDQDKKMNVINEARDSIGHTLVQNGSGTYIEYDNDFESVTAKGPMVNGLKEGEWQGIIGDSIKYICTFSKGMGGAGKSYDKAGKEHTFKQFEIEPQFKGGVQAFYMFLQRNIHYPDVAKRNNIQGKVFLSFIIENNGKLSNISVLRGAGASLDEEAVRVLKLSPPWIPAYKCGLPVQIVFTMPVSFAIQNDN